MAIAFQNAIHICLVIEIYSLKFNKHIQIMKKWSGKKNKRDEGTSLLPPHI